MGAASLACNQIDFIYCDNRKPYIAISNSLINHILFNNLLSHSEKIFYLLTDFYSNINKSSGLREIEKSAKEWAKLLACSEEWIFKMQKKLEALNYFKITREKDEDNQNEKNIIIPTLPDNIFYELAKEPNRTNKENPNYPWEENQHEGYKRSFLDNAKMFVMLNLKMIKLLLSDNNLTTLQKLIWIYFFSRSHRSYTDNSGEGTRNFITTYQEISNIFSCKENTVSVAVNNLFILGYISKKQFRIKEQGKAGRRKKKSCWEIAALFPKDKMQILLRQPDRQNVAALTLEDLKLYNLESFSLNKRQPTSHSNYYHDRSADLHNTTQYYNKNNILNIKNIDTPSSENNHVQTQLDENKNDNVFFEQNILVTSKEISEGLQITEKFNEEAFNLAKKLGYQQAIKQADANLSTQEHWLVTKTAYTLHHRLSKEIELIDRKLNIDDSAITKLKEKKFSGTEQILIELWDDFIKLPSNKIPQEEFLLRPSWILKLLPKPILYNNIIEPKTKVTSKIEDKIVLPVLPGDKEDKARRFAFALRQRKLVKGYAAEINAEDLALEFIHHAATWRPTKLNCKTREDQIDAALSIAWKAVEEGKWKCPYPWLNAQIAQREKQAMVWKCY